MNGAGLAPDKSGKAEGMSRGTCKCRLVVAVFLSAVACGDDVTEPGSPYPATVVVSPETAKAERFAETIRLTATVRDQHGDIMNSVSVHWSSDDTVAATVSARGIVTAWSSGVVEVEASAGEVSGTATITVELVERDALLKLFEDLNGNAWTNNENWGTRTSLDRWHGVETDSAGNVIRLKLDENGLSGEIPTEVKLLERLEWLDLSFNEDIRGEVPLGIGELEHLVRLFLHHNSLTGTIPSELANLPNLEQLDFHRNQLTGPLPEWLGNIPKLRVLVVWGNDLTGPMPASIGNLTELEVLEVSRTDLSGPLPRSFTNLDLAWFRWHATELCSPPDDEFQNWLKTIETESGVGPCDQ